MMQNYYLAVDIGASGGRHILGTVLEGRIHLEEVYRFENRPFKRDRHLCWDLKKLYQDIINGMKECKYRNKLPISMGIDTWGVDYVLLDRDNNILGETVSYRDHRTEGMDRIIDDIIPLNELYRRTGIQKQIFNTINQLMAVKTLEPELMERAESFLMLPDYFHYLLTGNKLSEYTNATTTQLLHAANKTWDYELIDKLGFPENIFTPLSLPMTSVGALKDEVIKEVGFQCEVVLPATHDTGSAVLAVPAEDDEHIYISSGTWSLMGIIREEPDCSDLSLSHNFTNEGGFGRQIRYLKNIMGLWMIQCVRHELGGSYSYEELCRLAKESDDFPSRVEVNAPCFLSPENMTEEIYGYLRKSGQRVPETVGELAACIYLSLVESYGKTVRELEEVTGKSFSRIHIIGGGANAAYLNELTAKATGKRVYAGPIEATSIGNLVAQMLKAGEFASLKEAKRSIYHSFDIQEY